MPGAHDPMSILGDEKGERSWRPGDGPTARDGDGDRIGRFAYAALRGEKDFALIRLKDGVRAKSAMCHFGGPTGTFDGRGGATRVLSHYGLGLGVGDAVPARSMVAVGSPDPDHIFAQGVVVPGDSGGPVTLDEDGRAVGVTVTTGVHGESVGGDGVDAGTVGVTRVRPQVERAERVLDTGLRIERAPHR